MSASHVIVTDGSLVGSGTPQSPLGVAVDAVGGTVPVVTDGTTVTGDGTSGSPISAVDQLGTGWMQVLRTLDALAALKPLSTQTGDNTSLAICNRKTFASGATINDLDPADATTGWHINSATGQLDDGLGTSQFAPIYLEWDQVGDASDDAEITGFDPVAWAGPDGSFVTIFNSRYKQTAGNIVGAHTQPSVWLRIGDARSAADARIDSASDVDIEIPYGQGIRLYYDAGATVWRPCFDEIAVVAP